MHVELHIYITMKYEIMVGDFDLMIYKWNVIDDYIVIET